MSSSFRRTARKAANSSSTAPVNSVEISTGNPSLDDLLLPSLSVGSITVLSSNDPHVLYTDVLLKSYIAQGLLTGENTCVVSDWMDEENQKTWARGLPWVSAKLHANDNAQSSDAAQATDVRIAWRYAGLAVDTGFQNEGALDMLLTPPEEILASDQLAYMSFENLVSRLQTIFAGPNPPKRIAMRYPIPDNLYGTLHKLKALLKTYKATMFIACHSPSSRISHISDTHIELESFSTSPISAFEGYAGIVNIIKSARANGELLPPNEKLSTLRGLNAESAGERNLAFRLRRRRLAIEVLNMDVSAGGGSGERKTPKVDLTKINVEKDLKEPEVGTGQDGSVDELKPAQRAAMRKKMMFNAGTPDMLEF